MRFPDCRRAMPLLTVFVVFAVQLLAPGSATAAPSPAFDLQHAIIARLEGAQPLPLAGDRYREHLREFYAARGGAPLFQSPASMRDLIDRLRLAPEDGLNADDYPIGELERLSDASASDTPEQRIDTEIAFAASFLTFAFDLKTGRPWVVPQDIRPARGRTTADAIAVLDGLMTGRTVDAALTGWLDHHDAYTRLKAALSGYRALVAAGGWPEVPGGETLRPGTSDGRVLAVRLRLAAEGDHPIPEQDAIAFDAALEAAVRRYQARHGLTVDGLIGRSTLDSLNVDAQTRERQIIITMERWRWFPADVGSRYIVINIAGYDLTLIDGDNEPLTMAVIVGKPTDETPEFSSTITYLDFNPYWYVPRRIALEEEVPKLISDPGRMLARGFEMIQDGTVVPFDGVDWSALAAGAVPFRLRQRPGPDNALGQIKFIFPNSRDIYLHDTGARHLFRPAARAFSHGCVRVQRPIDLANALLRGNPGWDRARIDQTIAEGKLHRVLLNEPFPVHLIYMTAWVGDDGAVQFRDDVYNRDATIGRRLFGAAGEVADARRPAAIPDRPRDADPRPRPDAAAGRRAAVALDPLRGALAQDAR
jgi:L,D-transpeptidase YcbB